MSYYIYARYYYFSGTFFGAEDGPIKDDDNKRVEFESRDEAFRFLKDFIGGALDSLSANRYAESGVYYLSHGEYERPDYQIRKVMTKPSIK